jgi:hypothetical protein
MRYQRAVSTIVCLLVTMVMIAAASPSFAQRPWRKNMYDRWNQNRAQRSLRHARDYSRDLHYYSRDVEKVQPEVAKSESEQIGKNIETANKDLATVRKSIGDDKEAAASLDIIDKHLAKAAEIHKTLHAECCKDSVDAGVCTECCNDITKELEKAMAEHAALIRKLDVKSPSDSEKTKP